MSIVMFLTGLWVGVQKTILQVTLSFVTAIPFTVIWNALVPRYGAGVVPDRFLRLPFWHVVGILILVCFIGEIIEKLTPKFVSIQQQAKQESKE